MENSAARIYAPNVHSVPIYVVAHASVENVGNHNNHNHNNNMVESRTVLRCCVCVGVCLCAEKLHLNTWNVVRDLI